MLLLPWLPEDCAQAVAEANNGASSNGKGTCLISSLCWFDSSSSDYASLAQWERSCFVISRLSVLCQLADIPDREALNMSL